MADDDYLLGNPLADLAFPEGKPTLSTGQRLARLTAKGASLGLLNRDVKAESLLEHGAEFTGSVPTIVGLSALGGPAAGAGARMLGLPELGATATRMITAGGIGTVTGGIKAAETGNVGDLVSDVLWNVGTEGAFVGLGKLRAARPSPAAAENLQATLKATTTAVPETPPVAQHVQANVETPLITPTGPTSSAFGPRLSADDPLKKTGTEVTAPGRVGLNEYVTLADEYGNPLNVAPETRFSGPRTQVDEYGVPRPVDVAMPPEDYEKLFKIQPDPTTGVPKMTPLTPEADALVQQMYASKTLRQTEMQFTPQQIEWLRNPNGQKLISKIDAETVKRDELVTSKLVQKTEEEVQKIVDDPNSATKISNPSVIEKSKDYKDLAERLAANGVPEADALQMLRTAEEKAAAMFSSAGKDVERGLATRVNVETAIRDFLRKSLQEKCT